MHSEEMEFLKYLMPNKSCLVKYLGCLRYLWPYFRFGKTHACFTARYLEFPAPNAKQSSFIAPVSFVTKPLSSSNRKPRRLFRFKKSRWIQLYFNQRKWIVVIDLVEKILVLRRANDFANTANASSQHEHTTGTSE